MEGEDCEERDLAQVVDTGHVLDVAEVAAKSISYSISSDIQDNRFCFYSVSN